MMRTVIGISTALLMLGGGAVAEEYVCGSAIGGDPSPRLNFLTRYSSGAHAVVSASVDTDGSFLAAEENSVVTGVDIGDDYVRFGLDSSDRGAGEQADLARVSLVTIDQGDETLTAGILWLAETGFWIVVCDEVP